MKRTLIALLLVCSALLLCGCGQLADLYDKEYLSVTDYEPPAAEKAVAEDSVTVHDMDELRGALTALIDAGAPGGHVIFDTAYTGDINADIASVCWQVRTQDALYAYCVENISYELSKIVSHNEATISISYTEAGLERDQIVHLQFSTGLEEQLYAAIARGDSRLVVLIDRSRITAEDVDSLASRVYREDPVLAPKEPRVTVNMLSGTGMQRLYEINFNYGMTEEEFLIRRSAIQELRPFAQTEDLPEAPALRALRACELLAEGTRYSSAGPSDIYSALILGEANSEGIALAYVELCRQLSVPCQIVYGQRDWHSCCWNIVQIDGAYYHVDVTLCSLEGMESGFLQADETMWGRYRWDISSYPPCRGTLRYADLFPEPL
ncbi:MAG: hypothetical protein IK095_04335 [Oscillospiraceae bacterium]|nr:hypothetical protein [Oscillospiraceae bacterium]